MLVLKLTLSNSVIKEPTSKKLTLKRLSMVMIITCHVVDKKSNN